MKTKGSKTLNAKRSELGIKETRAKLPQYKARKKVNKRKQGSYLKCLKMKVPTRKTKTECRPSTSSPSILKLKGDLKAQSPLTPKTKKKKPVKLQYDTEEPAVISKDSASVSLESDTESVDMQSHCKYEGEREYRNLGTPVVVEALSASLTALGIPESLQNEPNLISKNVLDEIVPHTCEELTNDEDTWILVASTARKSKKSHVPTPKKTSVKRRSVNKSQSTTGEAEGSSNNNNTVNDLNETINVSNENANKNILGAREEMRTRHWNNLLQLIQDENAPRLYSVRNKVIAIMKENCRFCFAGKLKLKVIYGSVQVYGYIMTPKSGVREIYSPRGYSSVAIQTYPQSPEQSDVDIRSSLLAEGIRTESKNRLVNDITKLQPGTAVIVLSNLENKLTNFLTLFYPFRLFPKVKNLKYESWTDPRRAQAILQANLYFGDSSCKDLIFDASLVEEVSQKLLNQWCANEWSCAAVTGGKGVGKSTTVRYLINTLLRTSGKVILLDLDPGQSECTPPACISYSVIEEPLLGPNFTHFKKMPVFQIYLGNVNVERCMTRYIEGIKMMFDKLTSCPVLSRLPIIVNTMGFTQGIGWNIMTFILKLIRPSLVLQIMSERSKNNFPDFLNSKVANEQEFQWATWCSNVVDWNQSCTHDFHFIHSQAERKSVPGTENWNMEPYQKRELAMVAYLSQILDNDEESASRYKEAFMTINQVVPYATPFSALSISIPDASVPISRVLTVINGNIVALCGIDIETDETEIDNQETTSSSSSPRLLTRSPLCACYGFGIIRGVDMESKEVFINTPLHKSVMQHVNCLVGCIPVPKRLLQHDYFKNVPYTGGNDILPTSREPRRGYFRMKHQNTQNTQNTL